jgi:hypothetical protein
MSTSRVLFCDDVVVFDHKLTPRFNFAKTRGANDFFFTGKTGKKSRFLLTIDSSYN